jgi:hypothetical protein
MVSRMLRIEERLRTHCIWMSKGVVNTSQPTFLAANHELEPHPLASRGFFLLNKELKLGR